MIAQIRKFLSPVTKEKILHSLPYRFLSRIRFRKHEVRLSCELTTRCNVDCDICTRRSLVKKGQLHARDMDKAIVERVLQEIRKFHSRGRCVYFVPMGLGEPLLYRGLFDLFGDIRSISKQIGIVLVTNGILLDEDCCEKLVSLEIDEVAVSLNAIDAPSYHQHMRVNAHNKVYRNVENLISLRNKSGKRLPSVFIQYIDYEDNPRPIEEEAKRWLKIMRHDDKCFVHPIVNQAGFFSRGDKFKSSDERYPCTQPLWRIAVGVNGDIYPCDPCFYSGGQKIPSLYLGNIRTESLFDLFARPNSRQSQIVEAMRKDDYSELPECERCNTYKLGCNCYFELPGFLRINGYKWL